MTPRTAHPVAPYLLLAELGAVLFGGTAASADERITLEIIGSVRMAGPDTVRFGDATAARTDFAPAREASAARPADGRADRHH
jgi:hypothetical protein